METNRVITDSWYVWVGWVVGCLAFIGLWAYSFTLIGVWGALAVGWLPAIIFGFLAGIAWPVTLVIFFGATIFAFFSFV